MLLRGTPNDRVKNLAKIGQINILVNPSHHSQQFSQLGVLSQLENNDLRKL